MAHDATWVMLQLRSDAVSRHFMRRKREVKSRKWVVQQQSFVNVCELPHRQKHLDALSVPSRRRTSAQQSHAQTNGNTIIRHLLWTSRAPEDYLQSLRPNICRLISFFKSPYSSLPLCMLISEVVQACMCRCVHILCKSCCWDAELSSKCIWSICTYGVVYRDTHHSATGLDSYPSPFFSS